VTMSDACGANQPCAPTARSTTNDPGEQARHWPHPVFVGTDLLRARYVTHRFGRHRHAQYTFATVTAGVEDFEYRGMVHHVVPGAVALVDAETVHTGEPGIDGGWRYEVLYADVELVRNLAGGVRPSFADPVVRDAEAVAALRRAHEASAGPDRLAASALTRELIELLVRRYGRPAPATATPDLGARPVRECAALLRERLVDPPSVDELAEFAGCSPFALTRAFRRHVGLPPHAYLTQCRVDRARVLLGSGQDVASTAFAVGFADQAHLTRHFRRHVGVPPGRFARERRNVQESGEPAA
jgi:AraC-like DNA-binding protein